MILICWGLFCPAPKHEYKLLRLICTLEIEPLQVMVGFYPALLKD